MKFLSKVRSFFAPHKIDSTEALADFLDSRSAFIIQKSMMEHSQARTARLGTALFEEKNFLAAYEEARWKGYRFIIVDVGLMLDAILREKAELAAADVHRALVTAASARFAAYPVPAGETPIFWHEAESSFARELSKAQLAAPIQVRTIPRERAKQIYALLPVKTEGRQDDELALFSNVLRLHLARIREEFLERADLGRLAEVIAAERLDKP